MSARPDRPTWRSSRVEKLKAVSQPEPSSSQTSAPGRSSGQITQAPPNPVKGKRAEVGSAASAWAPVSVDARPPSVAGPAKAPNIPTQAVLRADAGSRSIESTLQSSSEPSTSSISSSSFRRRDVSRPLGGELDEMALLASPSRGLDGTGAKATSGLSLTDFKTQERYRAYISEKLREYAERYPHPFGALQDYLPAQSILKPQASGSKSSKSSRERAANTPRNVNGAPLIPSRDGTDSKTAATSREEQRVALEEVLLLVRKLREGTVAAGREDAFVADVYELSVLLSILCANQAQLASSLPRLCLELHPRLPLQAQGSKAENENTARDITLLLGSRHLHHLPSRNDLAGHAHFASLLLIHQVCGQANTRDYHSTQARLVSQLERPRSLCGEQTATATGAKGTLPTSAQRHLDLADKAYALIAARNSVGFRRLLLHGLGIDPQSGDTRPTIWQRALLEAAVPRLRAHAWQVLSRAYMTVPLPPSCAKLRLDESCYDHVMGVEATKDDSNGNGWLERALLLDLELFPSRSSLPAKETPIAKRAQHQRNSVAEPLADWEDDTSLDSSSPAPIPTPVPPSPADRERVARIGAFLATVRPSSKSSSVAHVNTDAHGVLQEWTRQIVDAPASRGGKSLRVR